MPAAVDEAGDRNVVYRKPYRQRVWQRSGMRCVDVGDDTPGSAAALADRYHVAEKPSSHNRKSRFHSRDTEPADKLEMEQVLSFLDQMNFKPSKNRVAGSCTTAAANVISTSPVSPAVLLVTSDVTEQTSTTTETDASSSHSVNCTSVLNREAETSFYEDDRALSPLPAGCRSVGNADLATTPPRAGSSDVPHIPGTVIAWKSLSGDTCKMNTLVATDLGTSSDPEPLHSSPLESAECEASSGTRADHRSVDGSFLDHLVVTVTDTLPASIAASTHSTYHPASNNTQLVEVVGSDRNTDPKLRSVSNSELPSTSCISPRQSSPGGIHTPRLLSANASFYLEQEEGDVIVEEDDDGDDDDDDD